jgi:hypothetical protein
LHSPSILLAAKKSLVPLPPRVLLHFARGYGGGGGVLCMFSPIHGQIGEKGEIGLNGMKGRRRG